MSKTFTTLPNQPLNVHKCVILCLSTLILCVIVFICYSFKLQFTSFLLIQDTLKKIPKCDRWSSYYSLHRFITIPLLLLVYHNQYIKLMVSETTKLQNYKPKTGTVT